MPGNTILVSFDQSKKFESKTSSVYIYNGGQHSFVSSSSNSSLAWRQSLKVVVAVLSRKLIFSPNLTFEYFLYLTYHPAHCSCEQYKHGSYPASWPGYKRNGLLYITSSLFVLINFHQLNHAEGEPGILQQSYISFFIPSLG